MANDLAKYLDEINRLRKALEFYADPKTYERQYEGFQPGFGELFTPPAISTDLKGSKARAALGLYPLCWEE